MSKKTDKLKNILEANINLESRILNEQIGNTATPAKEGDIKMVTKTFVAGSSFPTGSDKVNTDSKEFKNLVTDIVNTATSNVDKPIEVKVQGGASAVGSPNYNRITLSSICQCLIIIVR